MSFLAYDEYKESGDSFLGDVPEHWNVTKLGFLCHKVGSGKTPKGGSETYVDDGVLFIRSQNVYDDGLRLDDVVYISKEVDEEMAISRVERGDVLLNITGASLGRTCLVAGNIPSANVNQHVCIIRLKDARQREFVAMAMKAFLIKSQIDACQNGAAREGLNFEQIGQLRLALPPEDEQKAISSFLDVETSKIDGLVSEQRRLIELLKEKRQAVISHAVTKGLNPNAPMKPSGTDWIGDTPKHWSVRPIRTIANVVRGGSPRPAGDPKYFNGDFMPWVTVAEITKDNLKGLTGTETFLTKEGSENSRMFEPNTLLYSNSGATLGVPKILKIQACANDGVIGFLDLSDEVDISFFYLFLYSITEAIREKVKQGSGQPNLNTDIVKALRLPLPPDRNEQKEIVDYIETICSKFDSLEAEAERAIELLQERRTALISAAVTGKIDVRGIANKEAVV
tara:strand:+ start:521 stop:1879 length:1359 start_codon:yes stop_codon:yes gene_type:complete